MAYRVRPELPGEIHGGLQTGARLDHSSSSALVRPRRTPRRPDCPRHRPRCRATLNRRRWEAAGALAVAALVMGACNVAVSADGPGYSYNSPSPGTVIVSAPSTAGLNQREFFFDQSAPVEADSTVCATFASGQDIDQQGVALRINVTSNGTTGITVSRNIFGNVFNVFNVHVWNTGTDPSSPFEIIGQVTATSLPAGVPVYPLTMCARTVDDEVQFTVSRFPGPTRWGDPGASGQATLPPGAPATGQGGYFAAHMTPGTSMTFKNLTVDGSVSTP